MTQILPAIVSSFLFAACSDYNDLNEMSMAHMAEHQLSLSKSSLALGSSEVKSGKSTEAILTLQNQSGSFFAASLKDISIEAASGGSSIEVKTLTKKQNGVYSAELVGVKAGGPTTLVAKLAGEALTSTLPLLTVIPGESSPTYSTFSNTDLSMQAGGQLQLFLQTVDEAQNKVNYGGALVDFYFVDPSSVGAQLGSFFGLNLAWFGTKSGDYGTISDVTDHNDGTYSAVFTSQAGTSGEIAIQASINGKPAKSYTFEVVAAPANAPSSFQLSIDDSSLASGETANVTLQALKADNSPFVAAGKAVTFSLASGGAEATFSSVTDLGNGSYTAVLTATLTGVSTELKATYDGTPFP